MLASIAPKVLVTTLTSGRYDYRPVLKHLHVSNKQSPWKIVILDDISRPEASGEPRHPWVDYEDMLRKNKGHMSAPGLQRGDVCDKDILTLQFTSGSTGVPKAACLTHHGMLNCARYITLRMNVRAEDRIAIPVPLFHAFGMVMGKLQTTI